MNWATIETALVSWVTAASGYAAGQVVLDGQQVSAPEGAYIKIRIGDVLELGACDPEDYSYNGAAPSGTEITIAENGVREFVVSIQAFGTKGTEAGNSSPRAVLSTVRARLQLPDVRAALAAAGISPFDPRPIQNLATVAGTIFEPRALFEVRCYANEQVSETTGYITEVEIAGTITDPGNPSSPFTDDFTATS